MRRFTIDLRMLHASGIGTYMRNIVPRLIDTFTRDEFILILAGDDEPPPWLWGGRIRVVRSRSPIYSISEQLELPFKIPPSDVFWSPHYNVPFLPVRARKRIVTIHDVFHLRFLEHLSLSQRLYARLMLPTAVRRSDMIITISEFSRAEILACTKAMADGVRVIHDGVDQGVFRPVAAEIFRRHIREKYSLPETFVLYVGNVKPHKNLLGVLRAMTRLARDGLDDFGLVVAGKYEGFITEERSVFAYLDGHPLVKERVLFTGFVDEADLPCLYSLAFLFVFPSLYEGFGLPPLEAMACGCPVVVSHAASLPEICGDSAVYVDSHDEESIAEGIRAVMVDKSLRQRLIAGGRKRVREFSWERSAEQHAQVFERLLVL